jgi:hypothetical protein
MRGACCVSPGHLVIMSSLHPSVPHSLNRKDILALLALLALVLAFFWKLAFTNLIIARGDIFYYFYPYRDFAAQAVREGRAALWNPYLFMGAPFLANSQAGFFYPFNLLMSWLATTRAINWTIVLHVFLAASGAYVFARSLRSVRLSIAASLLAAISFGLGGYLGTQIEHINQLQGLAWLGWIFLAYEAALKANSEFGIRNFNWVPLALLIAVQLLAGHTQSVFITLVGLGCYAVWQLIESIFAGRPNGWRAYALLITRYLFPLLLAVVVAFSLSAIQLLPTLELTRNSARSGGLPANLAVSFSLDPRLLGRALLPDYEGALPAGGEFTAFFSVAALMLMMIGVTTWRRASPRTRAMAVVAFVGLFLALGGYNPLYYVLLKIPGFDLFRAPARWIVLFAFAGSLLAGVGLDAVRGRSISWKSVLLAVAMMLLLLGLVWISVGLTPAGASGPLNSPDTTSVLLWLGALLITLALALFVLRFTRYSLLVISSILLLAICELFLATRQLTYNSRATAPDALLSLRPPVTYLLQAGQGDTPPDRFLSISAIFFDPGDLTELQSIYGDQLSEQAFYDLIVATKMKEIVAPNLPLYYQVPAVDGYDGGVLPLKNYIEFQKLFLDPALIQTDGRLREQLKSIPAARWLDLMNARYVLTDKVGDQWYDGVLHDLRFVIPLQAGETLSTTRVPPLRADALSVVYSDPLGSGTLARIEVTFDDGSQQQLEVRDQPVESKEGRSAVRLAWDEPRRVKSLRVTGAGGLTLQGMALVNSRNGAFQSFVVAPEGQFDLVYSGDVKIYENSTTLPRAFFVSDALFAPSDAEAVQLMQSESFNPAKTVVVSGAGSEARQREDVNAAGPPSLNPSLVSYSPEAVVIDVNAPQDGYLVLTDAYYPGWTATVDGQPAGIERADIMFRAVKVPAGQHRVELRYQPQSFRFGLLISLGTAALLCGAWLSARRRNRSRVL